MYVSVLRRSLWSSTGLVLSCAVFAGPAMAGSGGWVEFDNQTSTRLITDDPQLGANDSAEKDYAWGDVDHDGDLDMVVVRKEIYTTLGRRVNVLFLQEGTGEGHAVDGVFVDRTAEYVSEATVPGDMGFLTPTNDRDVALAYINDDDWLDIVTATTLSDGAPKHISHPRIYINLGEIGGVWQGFRYEEERFPTILMLDNGNAYAPRYCAVAAGDIDNDGDNDLYLTDYDQGPNPPLGVDLDDNLFLNTGDGHFEDVTTERLTPTMAESAFGMATAIADMNNDGAMDIVKDTALFPPQYVGIICNDPDNPGFFDRIEAVYSLAPYHVTVGNLNNDEWLDLVVTDDVQDKYMLNQGAVGSENASFQTRPFTYESGNDSQFGGNSFIADLDNDGFNDVYICSVDVDLSSCGNNTHLYRNLGDVPSVTLQEQGGTAPWTPNGTHDVAIFDFTGDGWKDLFVGTCNGTQIWASLPPETLIFTYPEGLPDVVPPGASTNIPVSVAGLVIDPTPGSGKQFVSIDGAPFIETVMPETGEDAYVMSLPGAECTSVIRYYVSAVGSNAVTYTDPPGAPDTTYSSLAVFGTTVTLDQRFEDATPGWTVESFDLTNGEWERVNPVGTIFGGDQAQPEDDAGGPANETMCFITQQHTSGSPLTSNVDGGPTSLTSPPIDLQGSDAMISYARWLFSQPFSGGDVDGLTTQVSNNGTAWVTVDTTFGTDSEWQTHSFTVSGFVEPNATVQVRFVASDNPNNSLTEAGIDNFTVTQTLCLDEDGPEIVHGTPGTSFHQHSFGGYIDPAVESTDGANINRGLDEIVIGFSEQVVDLGGSELTAAAFTITETGGATPPTVTGLEMVDQTTARLTLSRIITIQEWSTVIASVEDLAGNPIENLGDQGPGVNEPDRVDIGFLPTDSDQTGQVSPFDLLRFRQIINELFTPASGSALDYVDIDRNGLTTPFDLLAYRQLINGIGPATRAWSGASTNNARP